MLITHRGTTITLVHDPEHKAPNGTRMADKLASAAAVFLPDVDDWQRVQDLESECEREFSYAELVTLSRLGFCVLNYDG
jgi:hypothetical protein